jgi:Glyoxalase-like domain
MLTRRTFLETSASALGASILGVPLNVGAQQTVPEIPVDLDHIIVGFANLEDGIDRLFRLSGYRAAIGGSHPNRGTRNALLNLGNNSYLELLAPDPAQPALLWHKEIASLTEPTIIGWAVRHKDLDQLAAELKDRGVPCSDPMPGSRIRPDGKTLNWRTLVLADDRKGNLPFFIDWGSGSPHPSSDAPGGCLLQEFKPTGLLPEIPPPEAGMRLHLISGQQSQYLAKIAGLNGVFQLASVPVPSERWIRKGAAIL